VRKPKGKRQLGRPRCRWVDNIKMDLREIGWDGMDWIDVTQDRDKWRALVSGGTPLVYCKYLYIFLYRKCWIL
jgi:hypothetical protein